MKGTKREETGEIQMFIGEFNANLDDSHRLSIPNNFKKYLELELVLVRGFEKCLYLYNKSMKE